MKAVIPEVPPHILEWRKRTGADQLDEIWEGVLHMSPEPNREHQDLQWAIETWLRTHWSRPKGNRVHHRINVASSSSNWRDNYRIPDLVLLTPDRFSIDKNEYFEGGPTVAIEIRSPGDETYEKMPFYAEIRVPEVWVIDRDTKRPELYVLQFGEYVAQEPGADGWLHSGATGIQLRHESPDKIALQLADRPDTRQVLPEA
jgi:Uma2 family endonuclease